MPSAVPGLDVAPSDACLEAAEVELIPALSRESVLKRKLEGAGARERYDRILLDCRPSLGVLTVNAMVAADDLLIPVETQYFALEALQTLLQVVQTVRDTLRPGLRIAGIVPTKHEPRVRVCQVTLDLLRERHPELLTRTVVRKYVAFPEAQLRGVPIFGMAPASDAAAAYHDLALELDGTLARWTVAGSAGMTPARVATPGAAAAAAPGRARSRCRRCCAGAAPRSPGRETPGRPGRGSPCEALTRAAEGSLSGRPPGRAAAQPLPAPLPVPPPAPGGAGAQPGARRGSWSRPSPAGCAGRAWRRWRSSPAPGGWRRRRSATPPSAPSPPCGWTCAS